MKLLMFLVSSFLSVSSMAQTVKKENVVLETKTAFEAFVNLNAISIFESNSKLPSDAGLVVLESEKPTLKELNMFALEEKAQYFQVKGTNKVMKIESLYRLRLMYQAQTKN